MLAVIPAIAGCGSDDDALSPQAAVAQAADRTASEGGSRIAIEQTVTLPGQSPIAMSGSGVIDPKARRGRLTFDLSTLPGRPGDGADTSQHVVFEGSTVYTRSPLLSAVLPEGKRWLKIDLDAAGEAAGLDFGALAQPGQDPSQALRYLKATSADVKRVGEEDVRGVKTTHYTATIDLRRYPDVGPARDREAARRTIEQVIKLAGTDKAPMEVWIGEDGVARRLKQRIRTLLAPGMRGTVEQQIDLFDFGTAVDVRPPPADETQDTTELAAEGLRRPTG